MDRVAIGELSGSHIIIKDPKSGSRLHNRGYYGTPLSGGGLKLELIEGFYLLENGKIRIYEKSREIGLEKLLTYITRHEPTFEIKYLVYCDLRLRGHIVKQSNMTDFAIYGESGTGASNRTSMGTGLGKRTIRFWSQAVSERWQFKVTELSELIKTAVNTRKEMVISVVDEEGDLTYYRVSTVSPNGRDKKENIKLKHKKASTAILVEDRVMLWEPTLKKELRDVGFYGKIVGSSLQLALTESAYLMSLGVFEIRQAKTRRKLTLDRFISFARKIQPDFDIRFMVYRALKSKGLIVKTGFKYGTHFRVYEGDPETDHSEYLVHSVPIDFRSSWEEISRAVRLAQGVRKKMLFGRILDMNEENSVEYINIERIKP